MIRGLGGERALEVLATDLSVEGVSDAAEVRPVREEIRHDRSTESTRCLGAIFEFLQKESGATQDIELQIDKTKEGEDDQSTRSRSNMPSEHGLAGAGKRNMGGSEGSPDKGPRSLHGVSASTPKEA